MDRSSEGRLPSTLTQTKGRRYLLPFRQRYKVRLAKTLSCPRIKASARPSYKALQIGV